LVSSSLPIKRTGSFCRIRIKAGAPDFQSGIESVGLRHSAHIAVVKREGPLVSLISSTFTVQLCPPLLIRSKSSQEM
jgi:hypothetical protein